MSRLQDSILQVDPSCQELLQAVVEASSLVLMLGAAWKLARGLAVQLVEEVLRERAREPLEWPLCPQCGTRLRSKGWVERQVTSLLGVVQWERRVGRCPQGCALGQVAPLDGELGLAPNQQTSEELKRAACALAVFVPFGTAVVLLGKLTGVEVSPGGIWNWVQEAGKAAMEGLEQHLEKLAEGVEPEADPMDEQTAQLPLLVGADGVMAPFRPQEGSVAGGTVWREIKVGVVARWGQRVTRGGRKVSQLVRRRLVAVRGSCQALAPRLWLATVREGIRQAPVVAWVSDGSRGLWGLFQERFEGYATGILDFYHAAQNLWRGAKGWLDGRTQRARQWFAQARRGLRAGEVSGVLGDLEAALALAGLPDSTRQTLEKVKTYLETHRPHLRYDRFAELGLPLGSGMVESACKWLIQQRFKGVGMRWSEAGFDHLLHLRLAWVNEEFDELFSGPPSPAL